MEHALRTVWRDLEYGTATTSAAVSAATTDGRPIEIARCIDNQARAWEFTVGISCEGMEHRVCAVRETKYGPAAVVRHSTIYTAHPGRSEKIARGIGDKAGKRRTPVAAAFEVVEQRLGTVRRQLE